MHLRFLGSALVACALAACIETGDFRRSRNETPDTPPSTGGGDTTTPPPPKENGCHHGSLDYGPLPLPPAVKGRPYEAHIDENADPDWHGTFYYAGTLPPGLALEGDEKNVATLFVRGVPTESGRLQLTVYAGHDVLPDGCTIMPDPHTFEVDVYESEEDLALDGGTDAPSKGPR